MLKFPVEGGTMTLRSSRVISMECAMISGPITQHPVTSQVLEEKIKVAIHPEYPEKNNSHSDLPNIKETQLNSMCFAQIKPGCFFLEASRHDGRPAAHSGAPPKSAAKEAISAVLMTEREGKQMLVYFVERVFTRARINYTPMEKLVLALLSASRRLKRYFQAHTIIVITDQPIKQLLSNSEITGRMLKWKFELEGYDIQYRPRISIKGQILADFIVERPEEESSDELMTEPEELPGPWTLFTDGSSCIDGSEAGLYLIQQNRKGVEIHFRHEV
ncbi:reverse transcriptase domain-containing protein [Tanacetum coccineum]